ncbi:MAG: FHA domain-containing protein [Myxococcota bacterium]|nr:FHA domain-containing protein [Myxococcota bacterium]
MSGLVVDLLFQGELRRTVPFDRPVLRIGRMRENDIVVDSPAVSRFHVQLQLDAGRVFLEDGGSENGSLVNARRVRGRQELAPGDRIVVGDYELRVRSRRLDERALVDAATRPPEPPREEFETAELVAAEDDAEVPTAALMEEEVEELAIESAPAAAPAAPCSPA